MVVVVAGAAVVVGAAVAVVVVGAGVGAEIQIPYIGSAMASKAVRPFFLYCVIIRLLFLLILSVKSISS